MLVHSFVRNSYMWMAKKPEIKWYDLLVCVYAGSQGFEERGIVQGIIVQQAEST